MLKTPRIRLLLPTLLTLLIAGCGPRAPEPAEPAPEPVPPPPPMELSLVPTDFEAVAGWAGADLRPALAAFRRSCAVWAGRDPAAPVSARQPRWGAVGDWLTVCAALPPEGADALAARAFFAGQFIPFSAAGPGEAETGLLTGYYEPELEVRGEKTDAFSAPLHSRPDDLVQVDLGVFDADLAGRRIIGQVENGALVPYDARARIGEDRAPVIAWARPVDAFFLQVQGSGRLSFPDGRRMRAAFAAHNGRPYQSIGRVLIDRGELTADGASKDGIEAWVNRAGPEAARDLFNENPRYVFFAAQPAGDPQVGPNGAQGAPLTAMASLAVDPAFHAYGVPVWLTASLPTEAGDWRGEETGLLVVTQDTGGAITGPLRGDLFFGTGDEPGARAGSTRADAAWTVLLPTAVAADLMGPAA